MKQPGAVTLPRLLCQEERREGLQRMVVKRAFLHSGSYQHSGQDGSPWSGTEWLL